MFKLPPPENDGLYITEVGEWSRDKHHFLLRYVDAFTTSMKEKEWSGLHYVDLFAGAGIERLQVSGRLEWGSPLIAAQAPFAFTNLHLCDNDEQKYHALRMRMSRFRADAQILHGDANEMVHEVVKAIPEKALSLAFLDPYGLHLHYETLKILACKRMDLVIFFPDHLDALRNCQYVYKDNPNSNLDLVLGHGSNWRSQLEKYPNDRWAQILRDVYVERLKLLGYKEFEYERICIKQRQPLYQLIFCTKHHKGAKIWRGVARKKPDGQNTFDFGPHDD